MKNRFAIILLGTQNSGKTATLRQFESNYNDDGVEIRRATLGWKRLMFHGDVLQALVAWVFFVPSSPTESNESLKAKIEKTRGANIPELLILAEQFDGNRYQETIDFLNQLGYEIVEIRLAEHAQTEPWIRWNWDCSNRKQILDDRALEIGNLFREFINRTLLNNINL